MHLFYSQTISGNTHHLTADESKHCIKVLRLKKGDLIHLTDGKGNLFETIITDDNPAKCGLEIIKTFRNYGKTDYHIHIAIAPTKNISRFEWFLEKATEIGIGTITPIVCEHSERRNLQMNRLTKIVIAAMKQSLKAYCPQLNDLTDFQKLIKQENHFQKFIAYCGETEQKSLKNLYQPGKDVVILIGPEGDFSGKEVESAIKEGFVPVGLGPSRLRTETAALVACTTINLMNN